MSATSRPRGRTAKLVLGASAATATYMTWRLTNERNHLALDSSEMTQGFTKPPSPSHSPDSSSQFSTSETKSPNGTHVEDAFIPEETSGGTSEPSGSGGGAFNPQTGEINWDCPCLGGMAHGPCGPQFREAFSCFVFSEVEPKGIDCVEKFKAMQSCFREHPEVYADEIMDDDEDDEPVNSETSEGLPPVTDEEAVSETTSEKKPPLQKAGNKDR